jgi:hypothetical protein
MHLAAAGRHDGRCAHGGTIGEREGEGRVEDRTSGEVVIHDERGRVRDKDTVSPANDPNPPKDKRH